MLFFVILLIGIIASIVLFMKDIEEGGGAVMIIMGIYLLFLTAIGGITHSDETKNIKEYLSFKDEIEYYYEIYPYREQLSEGEIKEAIEYNRWLEKGQINNKSLWLGWFTPNRFEDLKKIDIGELF